MNWNFPPSAGGFDWGFKPQQPGAWGLQDKAIDWTSWKPQDGMNSGAMAALMGGQGLMQQGQQQQPMPMQPMPMQQQQPAQQMNPQLLEMLRARMQQQPPVQRRQLSPGVPGGDLGLGLLAGLRR